MYAADVEERGRRVHRARATGTRLRLNRSWLKFVLLAFKCSDAVDMVALIESAPNAMMMVHPNLAWFVCVCFEEAWRSLNG